MVRMLTLLVIGSMLSVGCVPEDAKPRPAGQVEDRRVPLTRNVSVPYSSVLSTGSAFCEVDAVYRDIPRDIVRQMLGHVPGYIATYKIVRLRGP
jgi:hypothetical protein